MIKNSLNICKSFYDVFLYKIIKYYDPLIDKYTYDWNSHTINKFNKFRSYNNCVFINKYQNVVYNEKNNMYYNMGIIYNVSTSLNNDINNDIAIFEDDIESIRLTLLSSDNLEYTIIDENFVRNILNYSTNKSILEPLLYYYLQKYLLNHDKIINVEFNINNTFYKIKYNYILSYIIYELSN